MTFVGSGYDLLDHGSSNYGLLHVVVNKVLLAHSHTHLFPYCLWVLSHYKGRVE